ncbi:MAG: VWA domain-containing protein [Bryobacteraceae bacterium]|nr:VWA domain-containing protein [Bryobacteraceae bacterium]
MLDLLLLFLAQTGTNRAQETVTFKSNTQLVIETVTVKDRSGQPMAGLTAKDFTLTEDGVPQEIKFFEFQQVAAGAAMPMPDTQRVPAYARLPHTQIAAPAPGDTRYRDHRLLALYFDLSAMPPPDQMRAFSAARKFLRQQMQAADLVAIMTFASGSVQVLQDFTSDRERLLSTIETLIVGEDENAPVDDALKADNGAAFGQNDAEFSIFFTDRQLAALQTASQMLGRLNEKKSLIYFASGLRLNGTNNQAQLQATINAAIRAGVSFWPVDARGLVAQAPLGDATTGSPGGNAVYSGVLANANTSALQRSQDTLWTLGADTGGRALLDNNDLAMGIVAAQQATSSYYILGYYSTNEKADGKFRKVKISVESKLLATLDYRQGFYAGKVFGRFTAADKERQLEDALLLGDPITELTIALELGYFQMNRAEYFVPLAVKIPGSELTLARRRGADRTLIDFVGEIKDEFGTTVTNLRDKVDIKLTGATAAELATRPIQYDTGFTLLPGKYKIKFLARDAETGRIGTYEMPFQIPNLNRVEDRLAISSVVLGSQRVPMREALFTAGKEKGQQTHALSPLVQDGQKLIPSVTRVFRQTKEMYVLLEAYQQNAEPPHPLVAYVTFFRQGQRVFETAPLQAVDAAANRLKTMSLKFSFPLAGLDGGEYLCQVTVLDPATKKAAFWRAWIMVVR